MSADARPSARRRPAHDRVRLTAVQGRAVRQTVKTLQGTEFEPWADAMTAVLSLPVPQVASVVVVGEVERGKSTLVNALLGEADVVPSGHGVVTAGRVRVQAPTDELPLGHGSVQFVDGTSRPVDAATAREVAVTADTGSESDPALAGVVVAHDAPILASMAVVDTPGIAGLRRDHAELAAQAAAEGSVLLVVTDGGQVFTRPELEFLSEVSAKVEQVVFALTKIDQHPAGWQDVLAENRRLLRQHAPRFADAPICPVASTVALEIVGLPDADDLREYAGIDALASAITERLVAPQAVALANGLRRGMSGIERFEEKRRRTVAALQSAGQQVPELDAFVARLNELQAQGDRWSLDLNSDSSVLRADVLHEASQAFAEVRRRWVAQAHELRAGKPDQVVERVALQLTEELRVIVTTSLQRFIGGFNQQAEELFSSIGRDLASAVRLDPATDDLAMAEVAEAEYAGGFDVTLASTAMIGSSMGGLVAGLIAPALIAPVFSLVGGAAWYVVNYRHRRASQVERVITQTAQTGVSRAETHLRFAVDRARTVMLRDVTIAFRAELKTALAQAKAELEAARRAAVETPERLKRAVAAETRHLEALRAQREELQALVAEALIPLREAPEKNRADTGTRPSQDGSEV
ncbi:MAG: dynamin family protein [Aeromicrobium sp.]|uniref:dynamin family protein n=1 Tax=Aeromicrobium sp. TaxID=1871063 RepID=UPI0039E2EC60